MADSLTALQRVELVTSQAGYTKSVGTRVLAAEPGFVQLALDRREDLLQFSGYFHGGVIAALSDHAAGGAVTTALPPNRTVLTIDLHINYLSPADGSRIIASATAVKVGNTVSVAKVDITTIREGIERLCATCTVTLRSVEMPRKT